MPEGEDDIVGFGGTIYLGPRRKKISKAIGFLAANSRLPKERQMTTITAFVKKVGGGWKAFSESGRPLSKKPKSKAGAIKQLRAVEISKRLRKGR